MTRNPVGDNEAFSAAFWSAMVNAAAFEGVKSGCAPTVGTGNWDVDVASGETHHGTATNDVTFAGDTATLSAAHATLNRVDLVTITSAGAINGVEGTAAADPIAPDIPSGHVLICAVFLQAAASSISASDIHDYRAIVPFDAYPWTAADLAANSVGSSEIATGAVTTDEIANGTITNTDIVSTLNADTVDNEHAADLKSPAVSHTFHTGFFLNDTGTGVSHPPASDDPNWVGNGQYFSACRGIDWTNFGSGRFYCRLQGTSQQGEGIYAQLWDDTNDTQLARVSDHNTGQQTLTAGFTPPNGVATLVLRVIYDAGGGSIYRSGFTAFQS